MYESFLTLTIVRTKFQKAKSHITLNPSHNYRPVGVSLVGPNGLFVELELKTYACPSQKIVFN